MTEALAIEGQVSRSAADVYEEFFVPALFGQWAAPVTVAAKIEPGHRVLDVACGTGVVAREAARRAGAAGHVIGIDRNDGMLAVARRIAPHVDWRTGRAEALPFADAAFDAVTCQFGLMFFEDRSAALTEMWRVLRPGGRLAVAVWDSADSSPGYAAMIDLLRRLFGDAEANALTAPFVLGDRAALSELVAGAGISGAAIATWAGTARFASIADWVRTDIKGWTLAEMIDDAQFARLQAEAEVELARFAGPDGRVSFAAPGHIVSAAKR